VLIFAPIVGAAMSHWKQFKPKACSLTLSGASKEDVLREVLALLIKSRELDESLSLVAVEALLERERSGSTGIGQGVAIPHVKVAGLAQTVVSLCVHPRGVPWSAVDGEPVHVIFTVLRPDQASEQHDPNQHLELLRWIAKLARSADFRSFALQAKTKSELLGLLREMSAE
jgi:mannitol/fructose-specific phosphotransferase system IIA component (Ntr-type)